eukprot:gnl/TRDRNA2_/TRDRNA2_75513_c0_seq1.p1 gnl/TRDRNA2_/TRDRNA2_75513_c0~~gnl/TRDRNA2_/TRDRNA2_75513_c0_seq1.p1  ORF type:complete len:189 (-),score=0.72 gnl/TRDRNA2_/TRDRNA2_75513_c0_seq1:16-582(-)
MRWSTTNSSYGAGVIRAATPRISPAPTSPRLMLPRLPHDTRPCSSTSTRTADAQCSLSASSSKVKTMESTQTIPWIEAEYRYRGYYTGPVKNGKPHGKGDFVQENGNKHLYGTWVEGVKQGEFTRSYLNGMRWVGNYVDDKREGIWRYHYIGNTGTLDYFYSKGVRVGCPPGAASFRTSGFKLGFAAK